jgi:lipoprotein-anchoring transpeptidase ErfK/SrfK
LANAACDIYATGFGNAKRGPFRDFPMQSGPGIQTHPLGSRGWTDRDFEDMFLKKLALIAVAAFALTGCISETLDPVTDAALKPRDKKLLASAPYLNHKPSEGWLRHLVDYSGKEAPGTVVVDTERKFLYLVQEKGKAYRYGVTVGEEGLSWRGIAKVGRKTEWPEWVPTADILKRMPELPKHVGPGPHNPMGARALYLYQGNKDTLFRIHGTNQPEYIGQAISSGCIRMLNEDVIDLYNRVPVGATVVVI